METFYKIKKKSKDYLEQIFTDFVQPHFKENDFNISVESFEDQFVFTIYKHTDKSVTLRIYLRKDFTVQFILSIWRKGEKIINYRYLFWYGSDNLFDFKDAYFSYLLEIIQE